MTLVEDLIKDMRHGSRLLTRNPIFAITAALSLAIAIGADTTIFTIANALLFRPPAGVEQPQDLVDIFAKRGALNDISYPNYLDLRRRSTTLDIYAFKPVAEPVSLGSSNGAERIFGNFVSTNYFSALRTQPAAGRLFNPADSEEPGASPIVVLSDKFWTTKFSRDASVIGQTLQLNGRAFTVIGVAPEGFQGTNIVGTDIWMPMGMVAVMQNPMMLANRGLGWLMLGGRIKPNFQRSQVAAELDTIGGALEIEYPNENRGKGVRVMKSSVIPGDVILPISGFLSLLLGIVSLVLIVACANVAGVLLARAAARRREIAVRLAIGADRKRLLRQLVAETLILFIPSALGGLLVARGMTSLLLSLLPVLPLPVELSLSLDGRVIVFTIGLSLVAALLCGLLPALQASKTDVVTALKDDSGGLLRRTRLHNAFVVAQVALSLVVIVAAGLFVRALQNAGSIDLGFDPAGVELVTLDTSLSANTEIVGQVSEAELIQRITSFARLFSTELLSRVRNLPNVQSASLATNLPMGEALMRLGEVRLPDASFDVLGNFVESGYFATMRIPLLTGRDFDDTDTSGAPDVAILGEATARQFWPGQNPVGKSFVLQMASAPGAPSRERTMKVIGVARDLKYTGLRDAAPRLFVYASLRQQAQYSTHPTIVVRTVDGRRIGGGIRALIGSMNPNVLIVSTKTLGDNVSLGILPQRLAASILSSLGMVGVLLAAIGIYGVTAFAVSQRTRELGIRMALGAKRREVIGLVLRKGMSLVAIGATIGLVLAAAVSRLFSVLLLGLPPLDPTTFTIATLLFAAVGLAGCYVPVRRATRINAMEALRHD